jgi:hypothetical protein
MDDLIDQLRRSGYGIYIGNTFIGDISYADDIVLASCTCYGLQKLVDVCVSYSFCWDIVFNTQKSHVSTFGGHFPQARLITLQQCSIVLNILVVLL